VGTDNGVIGQSDLFGHLDTGALHHDFDIGIEASQEKLTRHGFGNYDGLSFEDAAGPQGFGYENCFLPGDPNYDLLQSTHDCTSLYNPNPRDPWSGTVTLNPLKAYYTTIDYAPYAFDTITLSPQWKINGGVRWDKYKTKTRAPADPADFNADDTMSFASYQASVMYKPVENGTVYVMTGTSSIPEDLAFGLGQDGAFPASPYNPASTGKEPEKTRSYEVGTKWDLFGNRLLLTGDVFYENHTNAAVEVEPSIYEQIGKTRVKGAEFSANGAITDKWNVIGGYSYVDAKLVRGSDYDTGVGKQLVNTPKNTFSLWSTYQIDPAFMVGGGAYYRDSQVGYYGPPDRTIPSYWRFDALAHWQINPTFGLQLNVQNLFDKQYFSKVYYQFALPMPGRTFMATVDVKL
jgi:catecholate siderophore receptor